MVDINQKLSTRPIDETAVLVALNREIVPVVEKIRRALIYGLDGQPNLIWVNGQASATGTGSILAPFQTPAEALEIVPSGAPATIVLAPGDYSSTDALSIADRDISFVCLGGAASGSKTPSARALMPAVTFASSTAQMEFFAAQCNFSSITVSSSVSATLDNCSSVWTDSGALSTVRSRGTPLLFGIASQQSISGSIGQGLLEGMTIGTLTGTNIISTRGRVNTSASMTVTGSLAFYDHEFNSSVTLTAPSGLFMDQWSLYQALEASVSWGATPALSVQERSPILQWWGAANWANNNYLNPNANFGTAQASAAGEWVAAQRNCYAAEIHVQSEATFAEDKTFTLHQASTVAGINAGATLMTATLAAGQLTKQVGFTTPIPVPAGNYMAIRGTFTTAVVTTRIQVHVMLF